MLDYSPNQHRMMPRMMKHYQAMLQHLDMDIDETGDEVGMVVRACGDSEWMYVCHSGFLELTGDSVDARTRCLGC